MEFGASSWKSAILLLLILTNCTLANASSLAITATIDSLNDTNQSNNSKNINIDVVETEPLNIVYVPMGYNNLDKYKADINKNSELLLATYPLEKNNLREVITENIFDAGATLGTLAITELLKTMIPAFLLADQSFDRIVGVFPQGGLEQGQGFAFVHTELPVLIEPRTWGDKIYQNSMAHEIGHTFGFCEEYSLSDWDRQNTAIPFIIVSDISF